MTHEAFARQSHACAILGHGGQSFVTAIPSMTLLRLLNWNAKNRSHIAGRAMLLAALILMAHSFEVCNSHLGLQTEPVSGQWITVTHNGVQCTAKVSEACLCEKCACVPLPLDSDSPHEDGCKSTSELATRSQSNGFQLDVPLIELPVFAALPENAEPPLALTAFLGSDGPPLARLRSQFLASPLSSRAPPISA